LRKHPDNKAGAKEDVVTLLVSPLVLAAPSDIVQQGFGYSSLLWLGLGREALKEESVGQRKAQIQPLLNISQIIRTILFSTHLLFF